MRTLRILPPDVFDALELSALAFGGIGYACVGWSGAPQCVLGHAAFLDAGEPGRYFARTTRFGPCTTAIVKSLSRDASWADAGRVNDEAIEAINARRGRETAKRVPFKQWCKELNVIRGE